MRKNNMKNQKNKQVPLVFSIYRYIADRKKSAIHEDYIGASDEYIILDNPWVAECEGVEVNGFPNNPHSIGDIKVKGKNSGRLYGVVSQWLVPKNEYKPYTKIPASVQSSTPEEIRIGREAYEALQKMGMLPPKGIKTPKRRIDEETGEWEFTDFYDDCLNSMHEELANSRREMNRQREEERESSVPSGRGGVIDDFIDDFFGDQDLPF